MVLLSKIVLEISPLNIVLLVSILVLISLAIWILYTDSNTGYIWVYPLDRERIVFTLFKSEVLLLNSRVIENITSVTVVTGIPSFIGVGGTGDYVVMLVRGPSIYVWTITISTVAGYILTLYKYRKVVRKYSIKNIALLLVLIVLFVMPIVSLFIYINEGFNNGFNYHEVVVYENLECKTINITELALVGYNCVDGVKDEIQGDVGKIYLVAFKVDLKDQENPLVIFTVDNRPLGITHGMYGMSKFITSGNVNIIVLSRQPLANSTLIYYKGEFTEKPGFSLIVAVIPVLMLVVDLVIAGVFYYKLKKV